MTDPNEPLPPGPTVDEYMRAQAARSGAPCLYCARPAADFAGCPHGFPGCARADDVSLHPDFPWYDDED